MTATRSPGEADQATDASHRIVVLKIGSGVLSTPDGLALDPQGLDGVARQVAALHDAGHRIVLVSSGAVAAGAMELGFAERPTGLSLLQACSAIGQSRLMHAWQETFRSYGVRVAQLLLTHQDLDSRMRYENARNTIAVLLERGVVPIVNENDSVAVEELRWGDNDFLSAEVAELCGAELLLLLTTVEGLTASPDGKGEVIATVDDVAAVKHLAGGPGSRRSVGGMSSKLLAVERALERGIEAWILNGRRSDIVERAMAGETVGTRFPVGEP